MDHRKIIAALAFALWASAAIAQVVVPSPGQTSAQQDFSVNSVTPLPNQIVTAKVAQVICQGQSVNYATNGVAPSASVGMGPVPPSTWLLFYGGQIAAARLIGTVSGATCSVEYFQGGNC